MGLMPKFRGKKGDADVDVGGDANGDVAVDEGRRLAAREGETLMLADGPQPGSGGGTVEVEAKAFMDTDITEGPSEEPAEGWRARMTTTGRGDLLDVFNDGEVVLYARVSALVDGIDAPVAGELVEELMELRLQWEERLG